MTFLRELGDALRPLASAVDITSAASRLLRAHLGVDRVACVPIDRPAEVSAVAGSGDALGADPGAEPDAASHLFHILGERAWSELEAGRTVAIDDADRDPRTSTSDAAAAMQRLSIAALVAVPVVARGRLVGILVVQHRTARSWSVSELALARGVADLTWAAVDRAAAESALRARTSQLDTLLNRAPLGVYLVDDDLRILQANPPAREVFGDIPHLVGRSFDEVIHRLWSGAYADEVVRRFRHTLETGESYTTQERSERRRDRGVVEHYEWRIDRIPLPGDRHGIVCYFRDVSAAVRTRAQVAATEERYRLLFESIDEGFAVIEVLPGQPGGPPDHRLVESNAAFERQTGRGPARDRTTRERAAGVEGERVAPPDRSDLLAGDPALMEVLGRVALTGEPARLEHRVDANDRCYDVSASRIGGAGSRQVAILFNDITERRRREDNLAFLAGLHDRLVGTGSAAAVVDAVGAALGDHLGVTWCVLADGDLARDRAFVVHEWSAAGAHPPPDGLAESIVAGEALARDSRAGATFVVRDVARDPRLDPTAWRESGVGSFIGVPFLRAGQWALELAVGEPAARDWRPDQIDLFREVANRVFPRVERAHAEQTLRETEKRLQLALDAGNMGTFAWDPVHDRTQADARMLRLFGLPAHGSINLADALDHVIHPDDRERYAARVAQAIGPDGSGELREDIRVVYRDGSLHWLAVSGRVERSPETGQVVSLVGMIADITERKRTEEALREQEERLRDGDRRKDEFLAVLAHELRNPLAPIRAGLELLRLAGADLRAIERVRAMMERQVGHMVRLIDDLLDVSRITSGKIRLQRQLTPLAGLVGTAVEANRASVQTGELALAVDVPEGVVLDVDPTRFVQIVSNVLHNAIKFSDAGGRVEVGGHVRAPAGGDPGELILTVTDAGAGISEDTLPRVFDLFAQGAVPANRTQAGLGIGLALARQLIEMHGGSIEAHSEGPGRGSVFTMRFPLPADGVAEPAPRARSDAPRVSRRVLVIDDNVDAANTTAMLVEALGGEARVAYDGETGLAEALRRRPDVVLLDIGMPGIDGHETCRRLRAELGQDVLVIALTGWGQDNDREAALRAGFDAHMTKPADPAALERMLADPDAIA